jgi:hypothetical protein
MKEQYQKDVETFMKTTKQNLNHMHLACILVAFQTMQMEAKLVRLQAKYCEDGRFQSHSLTPWLKIFEMFPDNLPKMQENAIIDWVTHPKVD